MWYGVRCPESERPSPSLEQRRTPLPSRYSPGLVHQAWPIIEAKIPDEKIGLIFPHAIGWKKAIISLPPQ